MDEFDAEWLIVGCRDKFLDGVILLTSQELNRTQLEYRLREVAAGDARRAQPDRVSILTCELGSYLSIFAVDYPDGLRALAERWQRHEPTLIHDDWAVVE